MSHLNNAKNLSVEQLRLFDFEDYRKYLHHVQIKHPARKRRPFTLQEWVERLGYKSPRSLAMVLKGQRFPTEKLIEELATDLAWSHLERLYFRLLVEREKLRKAGKAVEAQSHEISALRMSQQGRLELEDAKWEVIWNWYHLPLKQFASHADFQWDPALIKKQFRDKISEESIEAAFQNMEKLGLVKRVSGPKGFAVSAAASLNVSNKAEVPSKAIRAFHAQMLQRAVEALVEVSIEKRYFTAMTFRMHPKRLMEMKKAIAQFVEDLNAQYSDDHAQCVYQLNLQCFPHTLS